MDAFAANSAFIARRIEKAYRRSSRVIYPPVDTERFSPAVDRSNYFVTASRLVPYKRVDVLVDAFARLPGKRLVVVGDGSEMKTLQAKAPPNVALVGYQDSDALRTHLERARAFLYAAREDFGIVLAEAQAAGCPVIAFGQGGAAEIVQGLELDRPTGVLFGEQTPEAVVEAIAAFERAQRRFHPRACRDNALRFGVEQFRRQFLAFATERWNAFCRERRQRPDAERLDVPGTLRAA